MTDPDFFQRDALLRDIETVVSRADVHQSGDREAAMAAVETALTDRPFDSAAHIYAASIFQLHDDREPSYRHLAIALTLDPSNYAAHVLLARQLANDGNATVAAEVLQRGWQIMKRSVPKRHQSGVYARLQKVLERS